MNRALLFWGVALVTAGAIALAAQAGALPRDALGGLWRYWPVILIVIGLGIIGARTPFGAVATLLAGLIAGGLGGVLLAGAPIGIGCGGSPDEQTAHEGSFSGDTAQVRVDFNCGDLQVVMRDGGGWALYASRSGGPEPEVDADRDSLTVDTRDGGPFGANRQEWRLELPSDAMLDLGLDANAASGRLELTGGTFSVLEADGNAGDMRIDLSGASAEELNAGANAGSITLVVDDASQVAGSLSVNAGSLTLCAPDSVTLAVTVEEGNPTFSHDLDESGLQRSGSTWRTGDGQAAVALR